VIAEESGFIGSVAMILMYMVLIFSLPASAVLVAILALLDVWLNIRHRFKKVM